MIEGKLEAITLNGNALVTPQVSTAFPGLRDKPVNLRDVEQGLDQINRLRSQKATIGLAAGKAQGGSVLDVKIEKTRPWHFSLFAIGLVMVACSLLVVREQYPFPGLNAAYACVGAALLVWPKDHAPTCSRLLSLPALQKVGLISYGLYLWHWPLIVFYRQLTLEQKPGFAQVVGLLLACVAISYLSYRFIERPIILSKRRIARYLTALAGTLVMTSLLIYHWQGVPARLSDTVLAYSAGANDYSQRRPACHRTDEFNPPLEQSCLYGDQTATPAFAMWGDSHGVELAEAIGERLAPRQGAILGMTYSSCPPALNFKAPLQKGCEAFTEKTIDLLVNSESIQTIFLAAYYEFYLNSPAERAFLNGLTEAITALAASGKKIIIIASNPELPGVSIPQSAARLAMIGKVDRLSVTMREHRAYSATARSLIESLAASHSNIIIFDPALALCHGGRCPLVANGKPLLFDDNHLSRAGAAIVANTIQLP